MSEKNKKETRYGHMGTTYYFLPTRNLFGEDSVKETGSLMQSLGGKKTLIVTGNGPDGSGYLKGLWC